MRHQIRRNLWLGAGAAVALTLIWGFTGWLLGGWAGVVVWSLRTASDPAGFQNSGHLAGLALGAGFGVFLVLAGRFQTTTPPVKTIAVDAALSQRVHDAAGALAIGAGLPTPDLQMVAGGSTAEISGRTPAEARITLGADLIRPLQREEIVALLAHEVSHIKNGDTAFRGIFQALEIWTQRLFDLGVLTYLIGFASLVLFSRDLRVGYTISAVLTTAWILLFVGGIARGVAWVAVAGLMTTRELIADATAVELTRDPNALLGALTAIGNMPRETNASPCTFSWPGRLDAIKRIAAVTQT